MRTLILMAGAALALAACRNNDQVDNTLNVDENLSAENVVSNDVTAIDAVTGADANMAADVNYTDLAANNEASDLNGAAAPGPAREHKAPKPAVSAPSNTAVPATSNAAD